MRISFISKVTRVQKALKVANDTNLCSIILVVFLEFIPVDRAEIYHMNTPQNSSRQPSQPGYRAHIKRPLVDIDNCAKKFLKFPYVSRRAAASSSVGTKQL